MAFCAKISLFSFGKIRELACRRMIPRARGPVGARQEDRTVRIVVLVKRVPDTATVFKIGADNKTVEMGTPKFVMSPYDEHAVELAIQLKEKNSAEVVIVSYGPGEAREIVRSALAMGADSGLLVVGAPKGYASKTAALLLADALRPLSPDLILAGKQAVDDDASQVPERVAELLGFPHVSVITRFELEGGTATVDREVEGGQYTYAVALPAVFTTQKGLNTPRYPTLPNIMKAKKKTIQETPAATLGVAESGGMAVESLSLPRQQRLNRVLEGESAEKVKELVRILREEEKAL
jgi:electron transfer flavoprotein beta subunit